MMSVADYPIVLFDGDCAFCNRSVFFIWKKNRKGNIRFASLQSETAKKLAANFGMEAFNAESMALIQDGKCYTYSSAALRVTRHLRGAWPLMIVFLAVPTFIRNFIYRRIAANRHRIASACPLPPPDFSKKCLV